MVLSVYHIVLVRELMVTNLIPHLISNRWVCATNPRSCDEYDEHQTAFSSAPLFSFRDQLGSVGVTCAGMVEPCFHGTACVWHSEQSCGHERTHGADVFVINNLRERQNSSNYQTPQRARRTFCSLWISHMCTKGKWWRKETKNFSTDVWWNMVELVTRSGE